MAVNIVTGMTGEDHIFSADDRYRNAATFGKDKYVLNFGNKLSAQVLTNNLVRILDGMCINQGVQMGIEPDEYEDVPIENGSVGMNRNDIIYMRYEKKEGTNLESAVIDLAEGESVSGTPKDPELTSGNILDGDELIDDYPLYRVRIRGTQIQGVDALFTVWDKDMAQNAGGNSALDKKIDSVNTALGNRITSVNSALDTKIDAKDAATNKRVDDVNERVDDIETGQVKGVVYETFFDEMGAKNIFDYEAWKGCKASGATAVYENNGVTVTATTNEGATSRLLSDFKAVIPVKKGDKIVAMWESDSNKGAFVFRENGETANGATANSSVGKLEYEIIGEGTECLTFQCAVAKSGDTVSFKNIMIVRAPYTSAAFEDYAMGNKELTGLQRVLEQTVSDENEILLEIGGNIKSIKKEIENAGNKEDIEAAEKEIDSLKNTTDLLKSDVSSLESKLESDVSSLESKIGAKIGTSDVVHALQNVQNPVGADVLYDAAGGNVADTRMFGIGQGDGNVIVPIDYQILKVKGNISTANILAIVMSDGNVYDATSVTEYANALLLTTTASALNFSGMYAYITMRL